MSSRIQLDKNILLSAKIEQTKEKKSVDKTINYDTIAAWIAEKMNGKYLPDLEMCKKPKKKPSTSYNKSFITN